MSQHIVNTEAIVTERQTNGTDAARKVLGELVLGVRVDSLPATEAARLAAAGKFYPLTTDANGNLRVALPAGTVVETTELQVLRESRDLLEEVRDLLRKIA